MKPDDRSQPGDDDGRADATERAQRAFDHAVERELSAIAMHEAAATRHDEIAADHERAAGSVGSSEAQRLLGLAASERERAARARARAEEVRTRLRADNVDPEG